MQRTPRPSKALPLLFLALLTSRANAQQLPEWTNAASAQGMIGVAVAVNAEDESYVAGQYQGEIVLRKVAADGSLLWEEISPVNEDLRSEIPAAVFVDPDGNAVVVGYRYYLWNEWGREILMLTVLKYAPDGSLIYKHLWPGHLSSFNNERYRYKVTARMDAEGYLYIGTGGNLDGHPVGFNAIKVSPAGNLVRVSTESFSDDFFMVHDIRLLGDKLGLAGATSCLDCNSTAWVLDTAGTTLWTNVSEGEGGRDIVLTPEGSGYVLTWRDPDFVGDVVVYEVNSDGSIGWDHTYDQGRHESALAMEASPDGALLVMAKGNSVQNIYTDWLTMKVGTDGTLLWAQRYNEQLSNYETPYHMRVDADGNSYVTGDGGPMPGGFELSRLQLVTVKYNADGTLLWTALVDTLTTTNYGVGLGVDGQGGVFVLGLEFSLLLHYQDELSTGVEPTPDNAARIFPNPASGEVNILLSESMTPDAVVRLLDGDGREVLRQRIAGRTLRIPVYGLAAGVYVCEIRNKEHIARTRVVVR